MRRLRVAFVNENTLGHRSYIPPFVRRYREERKFGIDPVMIDAVPLPADLARWGDPSIPGLRRWGLDFHVARWRRAVSRHVRRRLQELGAEAPPDVVVVNTQSVGLELHDLAVRVPIVVCLDATFSQLARSPWFAAEGPGRALLPLTLMPIRDRERRLFRSAAHLLPWSERAWESLAREYGVDSTGATVLPPSVPTMESEGGHGARSGRAQLLFMGGDFKRKGGPALLACHQSFLRDRCDLHIVTESEVEERPGVFVHRGVKAHTPEWYERWRNADVFIFPSQLETFGIVLLEALSFGVPVVSSRAGAAEDILGNGEAGVLLDAVDERSLAEAIEGVLEDPEGARSRAETGQARIRERFDLNANAHTMAALLHRVSASRSGGAAR